MTLNKFDVLFRCNSFRRSCSDFSEAQISVSGDASQSFSRRQKFESDFSITTTAQITTAAASEIAAAAELATAVAAEDATIA